MAKQDIKEAVIWYNSKQKDLGKKFIEKNRLKVNVICKFPGAFAVRYENTRTTVLDTFPYMIHYTVDESQKTIIIIAVFHMSLNPEKWENR